MRHRFHFTFDIELSAHEEAMLDRLLSMDGNAEEIIKEYFASRLAGSALAFNDRPGVEFVNIARDSVAVG